MNTAMLTAAGLDAFDGSLVSTSLVLVFSLLVALCVIVMLEGKLFDALAQKRSAAARSELSKAAPKKAAPAPAAPKAAAPAPAPAPAVEAGIPGEVVAAIAAAVYCLEGGSVTVKSIRRKQQPAGSRRGAWGQAGVVQNTRPFVF
ncbi:sodium pump decarboxylase subunit gamma [uncultured Gemmiger sp.]|uniref:sodium pump decarboxylase subunit gamma n=1 Tax=uncultured Gemmiger sp. TaxID=1623490 RepID=UPI0025F32878|nr:sodium pump decarboxylase subunit gamma [uncultured Gemmiger sp.]